MQVETKFMRLFKPAALDDGIEGRRVCWIRGWDKCRVLFVVGKRLRVFSPDLPAL
jgi:hypothetical protein